MTVVIGVSKFTGGAWFIMVLVPVLVLVLMRLNRQYESEKKELTVEVRKISSLKVRRAHSVMVMVGELDLSTARALQYGRTLSPDVLRAVHIATDETRADDLMLQWTELGLDRVPLDDRRVPEPPDQPHAARARGDGDLRPPHRAHRADPPPRVHPPVAPAAARPHRRLDGSSTLADVPHVNVTFVPFHLGDPALHDEEDVGLVSP